MKFGTSAKYLIGIAVASSAALGFAGSALAADAASLPSVDQQQVAPRVDHVLPTVDPKLDTQTASDTTQNGTQVVSDTTSTTVVQTSHSTTVGGGSSDGTTGGSAVTTDVTSPTTTSKIQQVGSGVALVNETNLTGRTAATLPTTPAAAEAAAGAAGTDTVNDDNSSAQATVSEVPKSQAVPTVVLGDQRLTIQPVITSHASLPADLAAAVPTAPVRGSVPVPTQSTGLLSALTVGLATTIVPHVSLPDVSALAAILPTVAFKGLALLFVSLVVLSFGAWLRRAGHVSAARSDVADHALTFATSGLMGYVSAMPKKHNPFFVVADTKTFSVMFVTL